MSAGAAALLAMAVTVYIVAGLTWAFVVWLVRIMLDEPVTWRGAAMQAVFWPVAVWISVRSAGE